MQRLFSMFPTGWPGMGLLLLRVCVALQGIASDIPANHHASWWALFQAFALLIALSLGIFTPLMALLSLGVHFAGMGPSLFDRFDTVTEILAALALCLLGPGAYSIDACLFGRRVIILSSKDTPDSPGGDE